MSLSRNRLRSLEKKIESIISLRIHVNNMGSVVRSHSDRIKLLGLEVRLRHCNVIFHGLQKCRNENCANFVVQFLENELDLDEPMPIERASFKLGSRTRPIIAAFSSKQGY